jgi:hypothetical protein
MKTIFITISRGGLARNILRAGTLDLILKDDVKVIVLVPVKIKHYFLEEFSRPDVIIEYTPNKIYSKWRKLFLILFNGLVFTETEKRKIRYGGGTKGPDSRFLFVLKYFLFTVISKIKIIKIFARWIEQRIFIEKDFDYLFEKYKPDLLFCSSIYSKIDVILIKAAKRFKVISISMPKSWDTVGRLFFRAPSDKIVLNNEVMRERVKNEQLIRDADIFVAGFPQFDVYKHKKDFISKKDFCEITNLDENKPIILYASEGLWTHWDEVYIDDLIENYKILDHYNLILRPHFSNLHEKKYEKFKIYDNIYIDDENLRITGMFGDSWDPTIENMDWLADVINVSSVVITTVSTFVLDSFVFNKPVINIYYDLPVSRLVAGNLAVIPMNQLYNCVHYNAIMKEKSTAIAKNGQDVMMWIDKYLNDVNIKKSERENTLKKFCYKIDGKSSSRIADYILYNLFKK